MEEFKQEIRPYTPSTMLVKVTGALDAGTAIQMEMGIAPHLKNPAVKNFIIEVPDLTFVSSSGLRVFMVIIKALTPKEGKLFLVGAGDQVAGLVKMAGMGKWINMRNSAQECEV